MLAPPGCGVKGDGLRIDEAKGGDRFQGDVAQGPRYC